MRPKPPDTAPRARLLCVEDDVDSCVALAALLGMWGYEVATAYSVAEGLRLAEGQGFDLIVLDNWFEESSGIKLCEQIRGFDKETPILFYSAAAYDKDIEEGLRAGAQEYVIKPGIEEFREAIGRILGSVNR